jgi:integrase
MANLTTKAVENLKPRADRYEVPDRGCRGLYFIVQPSGAKSWAIRCRINGKPVKHTLGPWPAVQLAEARKRAADALAQVAQGTDPRIEKREAKAEATERGRDTIERLAEQFLGYQEKRLRPQSVRQLQHIFNNIVCPAWQGRTVHDIKRRDIIELVEAVAVDRPIMANRAQQGLSRFFNWLCERDILESSPCAGVKPPSKENARTRVLSDQELVALWSACDSIDEPARSCVRMLMLTGQRRGEVAGMRRSEIDGDVWHLAPERMKGGQAHLLPLSARALSILQAMPNGRDLVFAVGQGPLTHFERVNEEVDAIIQPTTPWTWHDIRRTVATGMASLGVPIPVVEKILNHTSGTFRGIVGTYQRYSFASEMRNALERWAEHLDRLTHGEPAPKVVPLRGGRI